MIAPTLTIGIPTYNRSQLLDQCLRQLGPTLQSLNDQVELLISDNASTDDTQQIVEKFIREYRQSVRVTSIRQLNNLGAVPNIFELILAAKTEYFLFIGDDDGLDSHGLECLIQRLNSSTPSHFIEGTWPWRDSQSEIRIKGADLGTWGYEIGLAWGSVYHVPSCRKILENPTLREALGSGIWGQIGVALIGVNLSGIGATVLPFSWGKVLLERPYYYGYENLLLSLRDLIRTHLEGARATGNMKLVLDFVTFKNHGFKSHILGLMVQAAHASKMRRGSVHWSEISDDLDSIKLWNFKILLWAVRTVCESPLRYFLRYLVGAVRQLRKIRVERMK